MEEKNKDGLLGNLGSQNLSGPSREGTIINNTASGSKHLSGAVLGAGVMKGSYSSRKKEVQSPAAVNEPTEKVTTSDKNTSVPREPYQEPAYQEAEYQEPAYQEAEYQEPVYQEEYQDSSYEKAPYQEEYTQEEPIPETAVQNGPFNDAAIEDGPVSDTPYQEPQEDVREIPIKEPVKKEPMRIRPGEPLGVSTSDTQRIPNKLSDTQRIPTRLRETQEFPRITDEIIKESKEENKDSKDSKDSKDKPLEEKDKPASKPAKPAKAAKTPKAPKAPKAKNPQGPGVAERLGVFVGKSKRLISRNKRLVMIIAGVIILALVVVGIVSAVSNRTPKEEDGDIQVASNEIGHAPEEDLEEDAIPGINQLMEDYYQASAEGDVDTILNLQDYVTDLEKIRIIKKADYIESFENIACYTKAGPVEGTYLLYAYNEVKLKDIDTLAPALNTYVIYTTDDGSFYIHEGDLDEDTLTYFQELSTQDNVTNLCNTVQARYNEAIASDPALGEFMDAFPSLIQEAVANASNESAEPQEDDSQEDEQVQEEEPAVQEVITTDRVNVRISDSQESDRVGQVEKGTKLPLIEKKGNGWSKVVYEGQEVFIKTEFLTDAGSGEENSGQNQEIDEDNGDSRDEDQDNSNSQNDNSDSGVTTTPVGKRVRAATNVNIRDAAREDAQKLGTLSGGQSIEVIEKRSDGWSKVKYNGKDAYVKTEFLE